MEVTSHISNPTEGGVSHNPNQSECISSQPTANGTLPHHDAEEAPPPLSDRSEDYLSDDSLTGSSSTNDISRLLAPHPITAPRKQKGVDNSSVSPGPVRAPPPPSSTYNRHSCSLDHHHHRHHHHQSTSQKRLSSTKSHASLKSDAAHIREVAGDDCCVHCLLACLFCETLSMCFAVGECLACGVGGAGCCNAADGCCCCCVEVAGEAACTEDACQAVLDCGILEDCCGSSECMEICLECCSICFPS
ncbi:myoD family inhibitor domain-containing protein [Hippoglossus hippoglossus]|uniref:myoD family inhibitor domain-containing protein n=1 Tax=Hippoglossus hippoglossus TaxID=8267 RepID=UPI00148CDB80|nr:myoD family inhibitor domain-containing protein [Hippoglossus hippoglossus]XP_034447506.1 myoD family inhibitor domain-containing protein [Hippoglossus hippoglossus]